MKKACVISGGGAFGAYGAGTLSRINNDYKSVIGISTGALMSPFVGLQKWDKLKTAYTSITDDNIFDSHWYKPRPFKKNGKIRKIPILITLLLGEKSIGTTKNLRKTIDHFFSEEDYNELNRKGKEILVGAQNLSQVPSEVHYFNSMNEELTDFKDWMWASANAPFFTSVITKSWVNGDNLFHIGQWTDGGLTQLMGLSQAKNKDFDEVDVIIHRTYTQIKYEAKNVDTLITNATTCVDAMRYTIELEHLSRQIAHLNAHGTTVNVYWLGRKLSNNSLVFDKTQMSEWWDEGYETAFDENRRQVFKPED